VKRLGSWLLNFLARALEPAERYVVLGDLAESGEGFCAATRDLLGLIVRRQAGLWMSWRPWLALFGVSCLAGVQLNRILYGLGMNLHKFAVGYYSDLTVGQQIMFLLGMASAVLVWSWTCGFVVGSLSGRAVWTTWSVFYVIVSGVAVPLVFLTADAFGVIPAGFGPGLAHPRRSPPLGSLVSAALHLTIPHFLFLFAALVGACEGVRRRFLAVHQARHNAVVNLTLAPLATWASGVYETAQLPARWPGVPWPTTLLQFLLVSWPAVYVLATARARQSEGARVL